MGNVDMNGGRVRTIEVLVDGAEPGYDGTTSGAVRVRLAWAGAVPVPPSTGVLCCLRVSAPRRLCFTASEDMSGGTGIAELGESTDRRKYNHNIITS